MLRGTTLCFLYLPPNTVLASAHGAHARAPAAAASVRGQPILEVPPQPRWNLRAPPELTRRTFTVPNEAVTVVDPRAVWRCVDPKLERCSSGLTR
jgi:hypothetical protein